jgi:hypothetical protein
MAKKKVKTKQLAVQMEKLPAVIGKELEECAGEGFENTDMDSFAIPFLRVLQSNSPQVDESEECYIDGAKQGLFFNSVTGKLYGPEIDVIPIAYYRQFIEWLPKRGGFVNAHSNSDILDKTERREDENGKFHDYLENGNTVMDTRMHYVLLADYLDEGPIIFALSSTGIKHSKKWMTNMRMLRLPSDAEAPMFSSVYTMKTVKNKNDDGTWYQIGDKSMTAVERKCWINELQMQASMEAKTLIASGDAKADFDSTIDASAGDDEDQEEGF